MQINKIFSSQFRLNMLSGPISTGLGFVVSAVNYPLYLHFLGYEQYGAWLILSTVITFAQMGLLGIGPALTKIVAEEFGRDKHDQIQQYFITAMGMVAVVGSLLMISSFGLRSEFIMLIGLKGTDASVAGDLLVYMVLLSTGVIAYQVLNSVLAGVGRIDIANYSQTALQVLPLLLSVPLLLGGKGIASLLIGNAFAYIVVFLINCIRLKSQVNIKLLAITCFSWKHMKVLLSFGGTLFVGSIWTMMVLPITRIVITRTVGVGGVPIFEVAYRTALQVRSFFEVAFRALMPEVSRLISSGVKTSGVAHAQKVLGKAQRLVYFVGAPIYLLLYIFASIIFVLWLGEGGIAVAQVFRIMLLESFLNLLVIVTYYALLANGFVRDVALYHVAEAVCKYCALILLLYCFEGFSITSVAWSYVGCAAASTTLLTALSIKRKKFIFW